MTLWCNTVQQFTQRPTSITQNVLGTSCTRHLERCQRSIHVSIITQTLYFPSSSSHHSGLWTRVYREIGGGVRHTTFLLSRVLC
jgi:hypothetical protein